jgi:hypothetical protein
MTQQVHRVARVLLPIRDETVRPSHRLWIVVVTFLEIIVLQVLDQLAVTRAVAKYCSCASRSISSNSSVVSIAARPRIPSRLAQPFRCPNRCQWSLHSVQSLQRRSGTVPGTTLVLSIIFLESTRKCDASSTHGAHATGTTSGFGS